MTLERPLNSEIKPVNSKGNQSWVFFGRTDAAAEAARLWPSDVKNSLIWKAPDAGKDWGQETKGMTKDEMVGWLTDSMDMSLSKLQETVKDREAWRAAVHGVIKSLRWFCDWTELKYSPISLLGNKELGAFLMAQWLRISLAIQGIPIWLLVLEDPTYCGGTMPVHHDYRSPCTLESILCNKSSGEACLHHN